MPAVMRSTTPNPGNFRDVYIVSRWDGGTTFSWQALFTGGVHNNANQGIQGQGNTQRLYFNGPFYDEIILQR